MDRRILPILPALECVLLSGMLLLLGCSSVEVLVRQGPPSDLGGQRIAVAPAVVQALFVKAPEALPEPLPKPEGEADDAVILPTRNAAFEAGYFVGHLHLAGGYVVIKTDRGMQHRSKTIEFSEQERYLKLASDWVEKSIHSALTWRRIEFVPVEALAMEAVALPKKRELRGSASSDLRDNQNLPRFDLEPTPLDETMRAALPDLGGAPLLLVPYVTTYYSHNGGWFVGQTYGTGAGARIRLMWAIYDTTDGRVLRWGEIQARHLEPYENSPNSTQVDDYLMIIEEALTKELRRRLLR